jgi:hypothetical protein
MAAKTLQHVLKKFAKSKCALALPVTFLILLVSTLSIISITYYFSVEKLGQQSTNLTLWQPGSAQTIEISDCGGITRIQPQNNTLTITINDNAAVHETVLDMTVGQVIYELPSATVSDAGVYLKGGSRPITNQSGASISQLCIARGEQSQEIQLRYRPIVSYAVSGEEDNKPVNNIRIYTVNLNNSDTISLMGKLPLKISCTNTHLSTSQYDLDYSPQTLSLTADLGGSLGTVSVPISGTAEGAIINLEIVTSQVSIERWIN